MAITNYLIEGSGCATDTNTNTARANALTLCINKLFDTIHDILSPIFTRVDKNIKTFDSSSGAYYRESYQLEENESHYLVVEINTNYNTCSGGDSNVWVYFKHSNTILQSNTTNVSVNIINNLTITFKRGYTETKNSLNTTEYTFDISSSFYAINLTNENVSLWALNENANRKNLINCIGKCQINDKTFFAFTSYSTSTYARWLVLYDSEGNIYYTQSTTLENHSGVDVDGYIVTLPVYLTQGSRANGVICADYKLESALQSTPNSVEAGAVYKIDGVDYISLNSLLLKV